MSRKFINKPPQKSSRPARRRSEANRPAASSSSSDLSTTAAAAESVAARRARSKSKSKSSRAATSTQGSPPRGESLQGATSTQQSPPKKESPPKEARSKASVVKPEGLRHPSRTSSRDKASPPKSPKPRSPRGETSSVKSILKKKSSKSSRKSGSSSLSMGKAISISCSIGKTITPDGTSTSSGAVEAPGPSTSQDSDRKMFVFLPDAERISRDILGEVMSELYGYLDSVREEHSAHPKRKPSASKDHPEGKSDESLKIIVVDIPKTEGRRTRRRTESGETESLIRKVLDIDFPGRSIETRKSSAESSSSSSTLKNEEAVSQRTPKTSSTKSGEGKSARGRQNPEKTRVHKHKLRDGDSDSSSSIKIIELKDVPDTRPAKRRSATDEAPNKEGQEASSSKPARVEPPADQGTGARPKTAASFRKPPQPGTSRHREPGKSAEGEKDRERDIESMTTVSLTSTETPPPSLSHLTQECDTPPILPSQYSSWVSYSGSWTLADSTPSPITCDWRLCYHDFIAMFNRQSATVTEFFQNLTRTLAGRVRQPGPRTRRFFFIVGMSVWMLIQDLANDYWFFCGGSDDQSDSDEPPRFLDPDRSLEYSLGGAEPAQPRRPPTVRNICAEAARMATRRARLQRQRAASREPPPAPEERGANIEGLIGLISERLPSQPLEPRRDFTAADFPMVTLSFQGSMPEGPATGQAAGGAEGEMEAETNLNEPADEGTADRPRTDEDPKTKE